MAFVPRGSSSFGLVAAKGWAAPSWFSWALEVFGGQFLTKSLWGEGHRRNYHGSGGGQNLLPGAP